MKTLISLQVFYKSEIIPKLQIYFLKMQLHGGGFEIKIYLLYMLT